MPSAATEPPTELTLPDTSSPGAGFYVPGWIENHAAKLQPDDRIVLYRALGEPGDAASAATAAALLAGAGLTARDTFDVLHHYRIPDGEILTAMTQPVLIAETSGDTEPLYTRREVHTIISHAAHPSNGLPAMASGPPVLTAAAAVSPTSDVEHSSASLGADPVRKPGTAAGILHGWMHPDPQQHVAATSPELSHH